MHVFGRLATRGHRTGHQFQKIDLGLHPSPLALHLVGQVYGGCHPRLTAKIGHHAPTEPEVAAHSTTPAPVELEALVALGQRRQSRAHWLGIVWMGPVVKRR
jgi:hypothetical protein